MMRARWVIVWKLIGKCQCPETWSDLLVSVGYPLDKKPVERIASAVVADA
jgi:hypothetical protein